MSSIRAVDNSTGAQVRITLDADIDNGVFLSIYVEDDTGGRVFDGYVESQAEVDLLRNEVGEASRKFQELLDRHNSVE